MALNGKSGMGWMSRLYREAQSSNRRFIRYQIDAFLVYAFVLNIQFVIRQAWLAIKIYVLHGLRIIINCINRYCMIWHWNEYLSSFMPISITFRTNIYSYYYLLMLEFITSLYLYVLINVYKKVYNLFLVYVIIILG